MARTLKAIDECTLVKYKLCNGVKKKVVGLQKDYFEKHGRYLSYPRAITLLIMGEQ